MRVIVRVIAMVFFEVFARRFDFMMNRRSAEIERAIIMVLVVSAHGG